MHWHPFHRSQQCLLAPYILTPPDPEYSPYAPITHSVRRTVMAYDRI